MAEYDATLCLSSIGQVTGVSTIGVDLSFFVPLISHIIPSSTAQV